MRKVVVNMRKVVVGSVVVLLFVLAGRGIMHITRTLGQKELPTIEVPLGGAIEDLKGKKWLTLDSGKASSWEPLVVPLYAIVHFDNSQRRYETFAYSLCLSQENGRIIHASLVPMQNPVTFPQAVREVERIVEILGIQNIESVKAKLSEWHKEFGNETLWGKFSTAANVSEWTRVYIEIWRHYDPKPDVWMITLEISQRNKANEE